VVAAAASPAAALAALPSASAGAPAAGGPIAAPGAGPSASVRLATCSLSDRVAVFRGRMQTLPGAKRMGMRFVLLARTGSRGFQPVRAPGLGRWQRSQVGVGAFAYRQTVRNLASNVAYRVRVDFRWVDADGNVITRARRRSPVCRQFVALPNLVAEITGAAKTNVAGVLRYTVRVSNTGRAAATAVPVRMTVDGDVLDTVQVASLLPGDRKVVGFRGPVCTRSLRAIVDPDGVIAESSESDNASDSGCLTPARN